jgi:hypothetical protein
MAQDDPEEQGSVESEPSATGQTPGNDVRQSQAVSVKHSDAGRTLIGSDDRTAV